ncbi:ABC transporter ATP-binding protein [Micromonospora musae]|uniref:ABC transporter ATP-binding protein n=1 Tax=Micromonospora musae TaxID=1894970 RepID=UPI0034380342
MELIAGAAPIAAAWLLKICIDQLANGTGTRNALDLGLALAGASMIGGLTAPVSSYLQSDLRLAVSVRAKDRLYTAVGGIELLSTLEKPSFRDRLRMAEAASQSGPSQVLQSLVGTARALVSLAGFMAIIIIIEPWLSALVLAAAVPALFAEVQLGRRRADLLWQMSPVQRRELFYSDLLTNLSAAKEARLLGLRRLFHRRMLTELRTANAALLMQERRELLVQSLLAALTAILAGAAIVWALVAAGNGQMTIGDVAALAAALLGALSALGLAVTQVSAGHHAGIMFDHFRELTAGSPKEGKPDRDALEPVANGAGITFDDVWFRYAEDHDWVLRGLTLTIPSNQIVAMVGENGSGKSTVIKLLCRFYEPTKGVIRWDGMDIQAIPANELRNRIGAVFQDFMSYEMTAAENVALGDVDGRDDLDLSPARIDAAAARAEVLEAVRQLPQSWSTLLSRTFVDHDGAAKFGVLLSGGQWQRLALARGLLRGQRSLLILDEPSSGLDARAEHRIHRQIKEYRKGCTTLLVSHRLNTVRDADRILVLHDGRITECGTHDELLQARGTYAELFELQAAGYGPNDESGESSGSAQMKVQSSSW